MVHRRTEDSAAALKIGWVYRRSGSRTDDPVGAPKAPPPAAPFFCWVSFRWTSFWWFSFWWASSRWASQNGRDLPCCGSVAFSDHFSAEYRLKVVGICHPTTARQIPTISPAPPPPPPGPSRSAGPRKLRRLSPPGTPSCSGRIGIDLRCICLAVGAAGRGTCV